MDAAVAENGSLSLKYTGITSTFWSQSQSAIFAFEKTFDLPSGSATYASNQLEITIDGGSLEGKLSFTHSADCDFAKEWVASIDLSKLNTTISKPDWVDTLLDNLGVLEDVNDLKDLTEITLKDVIEKFSDKYKV